MPLTDEEWKRLSNAYDDWVDDVGDILEGLAEAVEVAQRSLEGTPFAGDVLRDLRRRVLAAIGELADRTNELAVLIAELGREG